MAHQKLSQRSGPDLTMLEDFDFELHGVEQASGKRLELLDRGYVIEEQIHDSEEATTFSLVNLVGLAGYNVVRIPKPNTRWSEHVQQLASDSRTLCQLFAGERPQFRGVPYRPVKVILPYQGQLLEVQPHFARSSIRRPGRPDAAQIAAKGEKLLAAGRFDEAQTVFEHALEAHDNCDAAIHGLAVLAMLEGDHYRAWVLLGRATHIEPLNLLYREKFIQASLDDDMTELAFAVFVDMIALFPGVHCMLSAIEAAASDSPFRISLRAALNEAGEDVSSWTTGASSLEDLDAFVVDGPDCRLNEALRQRRAWRWIPAVSELVQVAQSEDGAQAAFALSNAAFILAMVGNHQVAGELAHVYVSMFSDSSGELRDFHPLISTYNPSFQHFSPAPLPRIAKALARASLKAEPEHRQALRTLAAECSQYAEMIAAARNESE